MSGPLASWVSHHSAASWRGRAVLVQLALVARHDGTATSDLTFEQLQHRTGMGRSSVAAGAAELRRLGEAKVVEQGGGRHRPTRYFVPAVLCSQECWACSSLAQATRQTVRHTDGLAAPTKHKKPSTRGKKPSTVGPKQSATRTHLRDGDGTPPQGGTVTHPESAATRSRRPSADAAAAPARVREEPTGLATDVAAARGLALLAEMRKFDRDAVFNPAFAGFRISDAWVKRYGGFSGIPLDKAERWLAWAATQVAGEQAQMQAASRHRLANPVAVADVLNEPGQERGAAP